MYAIVEINGQQFKAEAGKKLFVHHMPVSYTHLIRCQFFHLRYVMSNIHIQIERKVFGKMCIRDRSLTEAVYVKGLSNSTIK